MGTAQSEIKRFLTRISGDKRLESIWLENLSFMEEFAARQIRSNMNKNLDLDTQIKIEKHAADEDRHAQVINDLITERATEPSYRLLAEEFKNIAGSFMWGYFANPILQNAQNLHIAYVHGALTIEQFPFQVYTEYINTTKVERIREKMTEVLADERSHLNLGGELHKHLQPEERLPLDKLHQLEKKMLKQLFVRLNYSLDKFQNRNTQSPDGFVNSICSSEIWQTAWIYALACAEKTAAEHMQRIFSDRNLQKPEYMAKHVADELRHHKILARIVAPDRLKYRHDLNYKKIEKFCVKSLELYLIKLFSHLLKSQKDPMVIYTLGALALESRVFSHYTELSLKTDNLGIFQAITNILEDEIEHARTASKNAKAALSNFSAISDEYNRYEDSLFKDLETSVLRRFSQKSKSTLTEHRDSGALLQ